MQECWSFTCCLSSTLDSSSKCSHRYYFGRCLSELPQVAALPNSRGRSTLDSDSFYDFSVTIPKCYKDVYVNSFFPRTAKL